jgi:hypothetical protein
MRHPLPPGTQLFHEESDAFFAQHPRASLLGARRVDLGFIDGMHRFENALRDFINVEAWTHAGGTILLHDCLPIHPRPASRERSTKFWVGDTWKVVLALAHARPDLRIRTLLCPPSGLVVVRRLNPGSNTLGERFDELCARFAEREWEHEPGQFPAEFAAVSNDARGFNEALGGALAVAESSGRDGLDSRVDAIVDGRYDLGEYERWLLREPSASDEYLFAEARPRFAAADGDLLMKPGDLRVVAAANGVELRSATLGGGQLVPQLSSAVAERLLAAIDGSRTVAELARTAGADRQAFERLLAKAVGSVLFRADRRRRARGACLGHGAGAVRGNALRNRPELLGKHGGRSRRGAGVVARAGRRRGLQPLAPPPPRGGAAAGRSLQRFYRPASKIAASNVRPGALYETATRCERKDGRTLPRRGPRVGVNLVGGERYHELVCAHDGSALAPERRLVDDDGLSWGEVVTGRGPDDSADAAWFCPPRPIEPAHWHGCFRPSRRRERARLVPRERRPRSSGAFTIASCACTRFAAPIRAWP